MAKEKTTTLTDDKSAEQGVLEAKDKAIIKNSQTKKTSKQPQKRNKKTSGENAAQLTAKKVAIARKKVKKQAKLDEQQPKHNIKHLLDDDEEVILARTPHKKSYQGAAIVGVVCGILTLAIINAIAFFFMFNDGISNWDIAFSVIIGVVDIFAIALCFKSTIVAIYGVDNIDYVFTNKRIIIARGISTIKFSFVDYANIESIHLKIGLIDKIFSVGDIYIRSKKHMDVLFDIHDSKHIVDRLNKLVAKCK